MSGANFVTITPCPIVREAFCEVCKGSIKQPKGKGRPRTTCSQTCRKALSRALNRIPAVQSLELFDLYNCPNSVLEVWHEKYKRGKLWPEGEVIRVEFRYQTHRLTPYLARDLKVVAFHEFDRELWKRTFPARKHAPRKKKVVQLRDNDRNRDMEGDAAKWDRDGGFSKDAEVAVANIFGIQDRDREGEYNTRRNPAMYYDARLAELVEQARKETQ
jgi:hypothetical protein